MTGSTPRPRAKCSACREVRCLRADGTISSHRVLYAGRYRTTYPCPGVGKPPAPAEPTPTVVEDAVDVPVRPRFEIFAVRPKTGTVIHLWCSGYRPGAKSRSCSDTSALCGPSVHPITDDRVTPLPDALSWTEPHRHEDGCPHPNWRWCRPCLGHAATLAGLAAEVAVLVADRQTAAARGAP